MVFCLMFFFFFFFSSRRRHTRLTCDWSSDVCSSDLFDHDEVAALRAVPAPAEAGSRSKGGDLVVVESPTKARTLGRMLRSEERRVGKECRSRWWPEH